MEYASVTLTAYLSAAIVAALLSLTYAYHYCFKKRELSPAFVGAALIHTINLAAITISYNSHSLSPAWLLTLECFHFNVWVLAIALSLIKHNQAALPFNLKLLFVGGWPLTFIVFLSALFNFTIPTLYGISFTLILAVIGLISIEQLYRYMATSDRHIKLLCINLAAMFIYDSFLYGHEILSQGFAPFLWQSRAAISIAACLLMTLGALIPLQQTTTAANFNISRPVVFYVTSMFGMLLLVILLSLSGYYVRLYSGNWGRVIYTFILIIAVLIITVVFISSSMRARLAVLINKHLFRHKYDYRSEWLRIINYLAQPAETSEVNQRAFFAVASTTKAPGGVIWLLKQGFYEPVYQINISRAVELQEEPVDSPFCRAFLEHEWVYFPDSGDNEALGHNNHLLPYWARTFPNLWLIFPLIVGEELIGFMALTKPENDATLNWEDLDLLKTIGRQLASYLKRYKQAEQLAEGRQFDTYNKLVAFIIHDLNNLIAQQALMVKNAEKHKDNPAFVEDAINTISNSVERMNNLLKKLRRDEADLIKRLRIVDIVEQAVAECHRNSTPLIAQIERGNFTIKADQVRLVMTITNFIKNAQEATPDGGQVHVTLSYQTNSLTHATKAIITIEDNGSGMDWDFVHNRLFKPFDTTKSGKGMGIGVYLSREYISELSGSLSVISAVNEGTTITITLPLQTMD